MAKLVRRAKRRIKVFISHVFEGMASPAEVYRTASFKSFKKPAGVESMRGDWMNIGKDFRAAASRLNGDSTRKEEQQSDPSRVAFVEFDVGYQ